MAESGRNNRKPTGTYKPRSAYPQGAAPRSEQVRTAEKKQQKKGDFDFRSWFSKENNKLFLRQLRYYGLIVIAALLLTFGIINVGNDVFAFIKEDRSAIVTIEQGASLKTIASALKNAGIIEHPLVFRLYCKLKKRGGFQYGDYTLNSNLDYEQIISALRKASVQAESYTFTLEAGVTQDDVVAQLTSDKRVTATELDNALKEYDYGYDFLSGLPERRCRFEGYLTPGDYELFVGESAVSVIGKMLARFEETVLTDDNKKLIADNKLSLDEIITLASLVQAECPDPAEYRHVASVLLNRLKNEEGLLQLTCTINYVLATKKTAFTLDDRRTVSEYNTYVYAGLPKGPVCSPSPEAIAAVLDPAISADLYFICDGGKTYYAVTAEEHQANLKKVTANAKGTDTIR